MARNNPLSLGRDLAIDLGTANTLIYVRGQGVVLDELASAPPEGPSPPALPLALNEVVFAIVWLLIVRVSVRVRNPLAMYSVKHLASAGFSM